MSAAWKAGRILANAERIVAIELRAGAQGLEVLKPLPARKAVGRSTARESVCCGAHGRPPDGDGQSKGRERYS